MMRQAISIPTLDIMAMRELLHTSVPFICPWPRENCCIQMYLSSIHAKLGTTYRFVAYSWQCA